MTASRRRRIVRGGGNRSDYRSRGAGRQRRQSGLHLQKTDDQVHTGLCLILIDIIPFFQAGHRHFIMIDTDPVKPFLILDDMI